MSSVHSPDFTRVFDVLEYQLKKYPQHKAINDREQGEWKSYSIHDLQQGANRVASWLIHHGFQKGDRIAIFPRRGSAQWLMIDFGAQQAGLIIVPIHPTSSAEETEFILKETEAKICIAQDEVLYEKVNSLPNAIEALQCYHLQTDHTVSFNGFKFITENQTLVHERSRSISENDILTILYTSGTSGMPKGAVLTHTNVVSNIKSILTLLPLEPSQRVLSFLPISHVFERTTLYTYLTFGVEIYFNASLENLSKDFQIVKPFLCTAVPRTLEKMYDALNEEAIKRKWWHRKIIEWAMGIGERYRDKEKTGLLYHLHLFWARFWVLRKWKNRLGGHLKYMVVGAAALRPEIARLFSAAGITTLSGYGMTEASPFLTVNRIYPGLNRFGTVGIPIPGVELKIIEPDEKGEGEILVKGPNIMQGYYQREELNREVLTEDGWFKTGDVGKMIDNRFLKITDRKKDIFKTSAGKYIAPQPLENHFLSSPFILQCLVIGFNRPFVTAVFVPNFSVLKTWCEEQGIHWTSPTYMIHNIKILQKMQSEIDRLNPSLEGFKQIKKFILADDEWTVESKQLTASFKLVRGKLLEKYKTELEKLYA